MIDHVHALPEGYQLQQYTVTGTLGFGGFGITYSALDNTLRRVVAIKEYLPSELAVRLEGSTVSAKSEQDKDSFEWGLERFLDEARTVAQFDHPNVVRIYTFFEQNGTGYIVMEFIKGKTLAYVLKEKRNAERVRNQSLVVARDGGAEDRAQGWLPASRHPAPEHHDAG